ncbi:hypothetical protein CEXT_447561 [Caerostris extrusa]|uniref:Uncharacterized protein n=1 Tax=Caerostris extrusa TaxID=172846 RepID=A0AAV4N1G9_CAEEX|nr:hypothetical protein CEXT_447561 [Caerostris extrusa]
MNMIIGIQNSCYSFCHKSAVYITTSHTPAFLQFERELQIVGEVVQDFEVLMENDNNTNLKRFANDIREGIELKRDQKRQQFNKK